MAVLFIDVHLSPGGQQFRDDRGGADPGLTAVLAAYQAGQASEQAALTALSTARLLVPVMAQKAQAGDSEMALPTLIGNDGRPAVPAFTSTDALARWREEARPVPVEADRVWRAAVAEGSAVVIDVAGPVPLAVEGARLAALAAGQPVPPPHEDPDIHAAIQEVLAGEENEEENIAGFTLQPGQQGDLTVMLQARTATALTTSAHRIAARLAGRLRRGIEFGVTDVSP